MLKRNNKNLVYLSSNLSLTGTVDSKYNVYIKGEVAGEINSEKNIYILKGARVRSNLNADNIQVSGLVEGDIKARCKIILSDEAKVFGNIACKSLKLLEGAVYSGAIDITNNKNT